MVITGYMIIQIILRISRKQIGNLKFCLCYNEKNMRVITENYGVEGMFDNIMR